jgi:hypothetical protein
LLNSVSVDPMQPHYFATGGNDPLGGRLGGLRAMHGQVLTLVLDLDLSRMVHNAAFAGFWLISSGGLLVAWFCKADRPCLVWGAAVTVRCQAQRAAPAAATHATP